MELILLYVLLFYSFFKIGLFGFGGGYAILSLIQHEVVEMHEWLTTSAFTDIVAISQTTPGTISFNAATYVGYTAVVGKGYAEWAGVLGSFICTLAVALPSLILMTIVIRFYTKFNHNKYVEAAMYYLKKAVIGLIAAAALVLMTKENFPDYKSWIIFGGVFLLSLAKVNPILLIVVTGVISVFVF
ncbi:MAG: chromate transporter [Marinifilaceae bacterium]